MWTYEPAPTRTLDSDRGGIELLLEFIKGSKDLLDGILERTVVQDATVAALGVRLCQVLPEQGVANVD